MLILYVYRTDYSGATLRERLSSIVNSKAAAADIAAKAAANEKKVDDAALAAATTDTKDVETNITHSAASGHDDSAPADNNTFVNTYDAVETSIDATSDTNSDSGSVSDSDSDSDDIDQISMLFEQCQLTPREREVARLAYTGLTNPEIADRLCISQYTVKRHMHSVFEKLGISARIELVHLLSGH